MPSRRHSGLRRPRGKSRLGRREPACGWGRPRQTPVLLPRPGQGPHSHAACSAVLLEAMSSGLRHVRANSPAACSQHSTDENPRSPALSAKPRPLRGTRTVRGLGSQRAPWQSVGPHRVRSQPGCGGSGLRTFPKPALLRSGRRTGAAGRRGPGQSSASETAPRGLRPAPQFRGRLYPRASFRL